MSGMQERWDAGKGVMQDRWDAGMVGCRNGGMQERWDAG